jgi:hypothetical protein
VQALLTVAVYIHWLVCRWGGQWFSSTGMKITALQQIYRFWTAAKNKRTKQQKQKYDGEKIAGKLQ